jgi:hypothetical protein
MTQHEILVMARQVGYTPFEALKWEQALTDFAKLVEDKVRQEIIEKNAPVIKKVNEHIKELQDAVKAEREACAQICENFNDYSTEPDDILIDYHAHLIRARGEA